MAQPIRLTGRRRPKYGNTPVTVDGRRFASKKEARRYGELKALQAAGRIINLRCQPRYKIVVHGQLVCTYVADFDYCEVVGGRLAAVVEDVKSPATARKEVYRLKKRLMQVVLGVEVREV
jgi:hypothetical protein